MEKGFRTWVGVAGVVQTIYVLARASPRTRETARLVSFTGPASFFALFTCLKAPSKKKVAWRYVTDLCAIAEQKRI